MTETVSRQTMDNETLPANWEWASVEQLGDVVTGNTPSTKDQENYGGAIPLFKPTDLNAGYWVLDSDTTLTEVGVKKARLIPARSILVTCIGATIGKTGLSQVEGATNQQINALVPSKEHIVPEYLYFAFICRLLQDQIRNNASSTTLPILNKSKFSQLKMPIPPLNEQRRIVEKIEELFTKLDAGVRSLEQARAQLKSYRRSVLKAAVEGELSREWREAHRDELEPASELLDRILQERREKFTGKKYKEPASPNTSELPELPDGWAWTNLAQFLKEPLRNGHSAKAARDGTVRTLTLTAVTVGDFSESNTKLTGANPDQVSDLWLEPGDILIERSNTPELVGTARLYNGDRHFAIFPDLIIRARILGNVSAKYVELVLHSPLVRSYFKQAARGISGSMPKISQSTIEMTAIPLPPSKEIELIVEEVERRLSVVDKLEATVEANLKQAAGLRQSILKRALSGELVPQDPDDEPASVLLARIREECQAAKPGAKKKGARAKQEVPANGWVPELFPERGV